MYTVFFVKKRFIRDEPHLKFADWDFMNCANNELYNTPKEYQGLAASLYPHRWGVVCIGCMAYVQHREPVFLY